MVNDSFDLRVDRLNQLINEFADEISNKQLFFKSESVRASQETGELNKQLIKIINENTRLKQEITKLKLKLNKLEIELAKKEIQ